MLVAGADDPGQGPFQTGQGGQIAAGDLALESTERSGGILDGRSKHLAERRVRLDVLLGVVQKLQVERGDRDPLDDGLDPAVRAVVELSCLVRLPDPMMEGADRQTMSVTNLVFANDRVLEVGQLAAALVAVADDREPED